MVESVAPRRDPSYNPVFQVNFRAQAVVRPEPRLDGLSADPVELDIGFSRFDLALEVVLASDSLSGYFEYDWDLFDERAVSRLEEDLAALLVSVGARPDVPILEVALPHGRPAPGTGGRAIRRRLPK